MYVNVSLYAENRLAMEFKILLGRNTEGLGDITAIFILAFSSLEDTLVGYMERCQPLLKWTGLKHASHSSSVTPNGYFRQIIGRAVFPVEFAVGNSGGWMCASNLLVPTFFSPYSLWRTFSWWLFIPLEYDHRINWVGKDFLRSPDPIK